MKKVKDTLNVTLKEKDVKKELIQIIKKDKLTRVLIEPKYEDDRFNSLYGLGEPKVIGSIITIDTQWTGDKNVKNKRK